MRFGSLLLLSLFVAISTSGCRWGSGSGEQEVPITWVEQDISHGEATISFGYRGETPLVEGQLEPVAGISTGGKPDATAMVFVSVFSGGEEIAQETATVYEAGKGQGIYTTNPLDLPTGTDQCVLHYRVVATPGGEELTQEVALDLKK